MKEMLPVDDYLIQRGRMKLVQAILDVDENGATARSVTSAAWPLFKNGSISPLVIIELVAQTAGINVRWEETRLSGSPPGEGKGGGFIVGVKDAVFHVPAIAVPETVITHSGRKYMYLNYAEYHGVSKIGDCTLGEVVLQIVRTE